MGLGDIFKFYVYGSDDTGDYIVKLSEAVGTEGGFLEAADPGIHPGWPYGPKNMRHVWGVDGDGHRTRLPCALPNSSKYTDGGDFTLGGRTYTIQGQIGERRAKNALGG